MKASDPISRNAQTSLCKAFSLPSQISRSWLGRGIAFGLHLALLLADLTPTASALASTYNSTREETPSRKQQSMEYGRRWLRSECSE